MSAVRSLSGFQDVASVVEDVGLDMGMQAGSYPRTNIVRKRWSFLKRDPLFSQAVPGKRGEALHAHRNAEPGPRTEGIEPNDSLTPRRCNSVCVMSNGPCILQCLPLIGIHMRLFTVT